VAPWDPAAPVDLAEAEEFIRLHHRENPRYGPVGPRLAAVRADIEEYGWYEHTGPELTFGAQVAWRNASRCIGRLYWRSLRVLDRRAVTAPDAIADALVGHLRRAAGGGSIRPLISVFAPAEPGRPYARVWNEQLIRYAGYRTAAGRVVGDPRYVEFTEVVTRMGWRGKGDHFDVLPLVVETPEAGPRLFELPEDAVLEVPLVHPEYRWFEELGLRWHAVPAIANMRLTIGGLHYPLAPFNGWYLGTEIGARNLADPDRYDMLPELARRLGLDTSREATLWRDRTLVELNRAVLHSYELAGVRISDHHTESRRFLAHLDREGRAGREVPADWTWIVPPISGGATPVFHRYYHEADQRPNFYLDETARDLGRRGGELPDVPTDASTVDEAGPEPAAAAGRRRTPGIEPRHVRPPVPDGVLGMPDAGDDPGSARHRSWLSQLRPRWRSPSASAPG
jgi:nitric-oxide synthase